jgi:hypothetical protein
MAEVASSYPSKGKDYKRWSKEVVSTPDGITKRVSVEEIENGFLICISKYGSIGDKYVDENKKYYSETNPLEPESKEKKNIKDLKALVSDSFFDSM